MDFPDRIEITAVTINPQNGSEVKGIPFQVKCYYEDSTRVINNVSGTPILCVTAAMLPANSLVKKGDLIKRISKSGIKLIGEPLEKVIRVSPVGGYGPSHIELYTGNAGMSV
jgi:hypothetical protein